jgi:hypothetical protein
VEGFGEEVSGSLSNDCKLFRKVAPSSPQLVPHRPLKARPLMMHLQTVTTAVTMNIPKCVLKEILVQLSGVETLKICLFHCPPHMQNSSNVN